MRKICNGCFKKECGWICGWIITVNFVYDGRKFSAVMDDKCSDCTQKEVVQMYEEQKIRLFIGQKVNWDQFFREIQEKGNFGVMEILQMIGILSYDVKGHWEIMDKTNVSLNPMNMGGSRLYFVDKQDALSYASANIEKHLYDLHIQHVDEVIVIP